MECRNRSLIRAKAIRDDEFYTRYEDIEKELAHYPDAFRGKTVYCNCDDPEKSAFFRIFHDRFHELGLRKLIASCFRSQQGDLFQDEPPRPAVYAEYGGKELRIEPFIGTDGDFRSMECTRLLDEADIICTNPPFSLFREHIEQILRHGKGFLILGPQSAFTYRSVMDSVRDGRIWTGISCGSMGFILPDGSVRKFGNICWLTNLESDERKAGLVLTGSYKAGPSRYPRYENYDAINVERIEDIPADYEGVMGVPITFLSVYSPEQFEIIGLAEGKGPGGARLGKEFMKAYRAQGGTGNYSEGMTGVYLRDEKGNVRIPYRRLLIRKRRPYV